MPYPDIDPIFFSIGPLPIRWYALAYLAGVVLGAAYVARLLTRDELWGAAAGAPMSKKALDDLVSWIIFGVILGGRLGFVLFYRPELLFQLTDVAGIPVPAAIAVWEGGMSFHGGLIGVAVATLLFARRRGADPLRIGDLLACAAPIGLFFGRIANFINAELYGRPTDAPWGVIFPEYYDRAAGEWVYAADAMARHPSQLYEAFLEGLVLFVLLRIAVTRFGLLKIPGGATGLFLAGYGAARFFVEFFREPDSYAATLGFLTRGMLLSLPMIALGAGLVLWSRRRAGVSA